VFSELTLSLVPKPLELATVLATFEGNRAALGAALALQKEAPRPRSLEFLDETTCAAMTRQGVPLPVGTRAVLLLDLDDDVGQSLERVGNALTKFPGCVDVQVAQDASRRDMLWNARRAMSPMVKTLSKFKIAEDIVVPPSRLPELVSAIEHDAQALGVRSLVYGHVGDGNLHANYLYDDEDGFQSVQQLIPKLMERVIKLEGTLTGEHGIGTTKLPYLHLEQGPSLRDLQHRLKHAFDPKGLLNPGKAIGPQEPHSC
jgi:glycolate oxidase